MKNEEELVSRLERRKPFGIVYDGEDFGIYKFNYNNNWYEGMIGHINIESMYRAIKDRSYFIQVYEV